MLTVLSSAMAFSQTIASQHDLLQAPQSEQCLLWTTHDLVVVFGLYSWRAVWAYQLNKCIRIIH